MHKSLLAGFFTACYFVLAAQTPGYLGKKLSVQAEINSFFTRKGPTANNNGENGWYSDQETPGAIGMNWRAGLSVGYVISRRHQLYVSGDYLRTGIIHYAYAPYQFPFSDPQLAQYSVFHEASGYSGAIGVRFFKTQAGALAPMGFYNGLALQATMLNANITRKALQSGEQSTTPFGIEDASALSLAANYEVGSNFIIRDKVLLTLGARLNIPLRFRKLDLFDESSAELTGDYLADNKTLFERAAITRMAYLSVFSIHLGVGLLAH